MNKIETKKPNFFILGAPKAGTTALAEYLRAHSDIYFSHPKELDYFNDDIPHGSRGAKNQKEYLKHFKGVKDERAIGEGTPMYLYSKTAVPNILDFNPDAKFIVMIRNPIDMAYSFYSQVSYILLEDAPDFETAWHLQETRRRGEDIPRRNRGDATLLQYGSICRQGEQLRRLFERVHRQQVHVIVFDDFVKNTKREYEKVLQFLEVSPDGRTEFTPKNISKKFRLKSVRRAVLYFSEKIYPKIEPFSNYVKKLFGIKDWNIIHGGIDEINARRGVKRPPLREEFKEELKDYFREDVKLLSKLLDRDLTHWVA